MKNFSCSYSRLYADGGFYESAAAAQTLLDLGDECRWNANLYPSYGYDRPQPANVISRDAEFTVELEDACRDWNTAFPRGSSSDLFELQNGLLFNRCLYKVAGDEIVQMYETNKPNDRPWRKNLDPAVDLKEIKQPRDADKDFFYLGSIGSENYGHWLIDDVTRARSLLVHFPPDRIPTIVLNSYFPVIDSVREQTLRALTYDIAEINVLFLKYRSAFFFPRLFYVSPSTYHPLLKSPLGVAFLRDHFVEQSVRMLAAGGRRPNPQRGKRIFVTRRALWRNATNLDALINYFHRLDFDIVELETLPFVEQVAAFSRAQVVVGVMGAGMANSVFSPDGATIVHLAPEGWKEPFFWDLAAVKQQRYAVIFGEPEYPNSPSFTPFTIDLAKLAVIAEWCP